MGLLGGATRPRGLAALIPELSRPSAGMRSRWRPMAFWEAPKPLQWVLSVRVATPLLQARLAPQGAPRAPWFPFVMKQTQTHPPIPWSPVSQLAASPRPWLGCALILASVACMGCAESTRTVSATPGGSGGGAVTPPVVTASAADDAAQASTPKPKAKTPVFTYKVVKRYPHDRGAYTQGLLWYDGKLFESTGQRGESTIRHVDLETGKVLKKRDLPRQVFGEGLAAVNGLFYMLTWKVGQAFLYDTKTLRPLSYTYSYPGEGWGLTTCEEGLVMSNGTPTIRFLEPKGMKLIREIQVRDQGQLIDELNELEWIDGEIWANVWKSNRVARIDPATGKVNAWVDMTGLLGNERVAMPDEEVLNGIAYDEEGKRLFMTGKRWPFLYHVELSPKPN